MTSLNITFDSQYPLFIGGELIEPDNGYMDVLNPATGEKLTQIARGNATDIDKAVQAAQGAFNQWAATTIEARSRYLNAIADILETHQDRLMMIDCLDTGRPIYEFIADYTMAINQFRYFAAAILTHEGHARTIVNGQLIVQKEPIGVCGQIIPWNVPMIMIAFKLAPALAAGNTIVLKPAEDASLSCLEFAKLFQSILPKGVVNIVTGLGTEAGDALIHHPGIQKLAFTGSTAVGRLVAKAAGERIIPVSLELGGKGPQIIFPDVDIDDAVDTAAMGFYTFNGQGCLLGTRLFLHRDIYDEFITKLIHRVEQLQIGVPTDPDTRISTLINEKQGKRVLQYIEDGKKGGATLLTGGNRRHVPGCEFGYFIEPTIFEANNDMKISQEEIFGPVLTVIAWEDFEVMIMEANRVAYGLSAGIATNNMELALKAAHQLKAGNVWINQFINFQTGAPFGGYKESGIGRESGRETLDAYMQSKTITLAYRLPPAGSFG